MVKKNTNRKHQKNQSGFTLLEVLMAIAVLSIGLMAVAMMQAHFATGNARSRQMTRATDIAMNQMEILANLTNLDDARLDTGNHTQIIGDFDRDYTLAWNITNNGDRTLSIDIAVSWSTNGITHTLNFPWVKSI